MSLCDTCPQPGHCCRLVHLSVTEKGIPVSMAEKATGKREAEAIMRRHNFQQKSRAKFHGTPHYPLPFKPAERIDGKYWKWTCPNLNAVTGRCDDYENRPELCRSYQPKDDPLCILHESHMPSTELSPDSSTVGIPTGDNDMNTEDTKNTGSETHIDHADNVNVEAPAKAEPKEEPKDKQETDTGSDKADDKSE